MNRYMGLLALVMLFANGVEAGQGCIGGRAAGSGRFVCFDGRTLGMEGNGIAWNARRGCFMSRAPCCAYKATHYGLYRNLQDMYLGFAQCRQNYPYRLGEMQTH